MFKIISNKVTFEYSDFGAARLAEASFRALRENYSFHYPDGTIYECKNNNLK